MGTEYGSLGIFASVAWNTSRAVCPVRGSSRVEIHREIYGGLSMWMNVREICDIGELSTRMDGDCKWKGRGRHASTWVEQGGWGRGPRKEDAENGGRGGRFGGGNAGEMREGLGLFTLLV
jgi:hypothetical protein